MKTLFIIITLVVGSMAFEAHGTTESIIIDNNHNKCERKCRKEGLSRSACRKICRNNCNTEITKVLTVDVSSD